MIRRTPSYSKLDQLYSRKGAPKGFKAFSANHGVDTPNTCAVRRARFFDTITGFGGSGHISLWDGNAVVDGGDCFASSPRTCFRTLS